MQAFGRQRDSFPENHANSLGDFPALITITFQRGRHFYDALAIWKGFVVKKILKALTLTLLSANLFAVAPVGDFSLVLNLYEVSSPLTREGITLGMNSLASSGFDPDFDLFLPPPLGVGYYFAVDTVYPFNKLSADFRNTSAFGSIWQIDKSNTSFGAYVLWEDSCAIFSEDSATLYFKIIDVFDPIPERPFFDSTWSTMFAIDTISYNPTLQRLLFSVDFFTPTRIAETLPREMRIFPPRPNPFNSSVLIEIEPGGEFPIEAQIYNIRGQCLREIYLESCDQNRITWDGRDNRGLEAAGGTYLMRIRDSSGQQKDFSIVLLK